MGQKKLLKQPGEVFLRADIERPGDVEVTFPENVNVYSTCSSTSSPTIRSSQKRSSKQRSSKSGVARSGFELEKKNET